MTFDVSNTSFFLAATILSGTKIDYNQTAINSKIVQWLSMIVKSVYDITNEECGSFGGEFKYEDNLTPSCIIIESCRVSNVSNNDIAGQYEHVEVEKRDAGLNSNIKHRSVDWRQQNTRVDETDGTQSERWGWYQCVRYFVMKWKKDWWNDVIGLWLLFVWVIVWYNKMHIFFSVCLSSTLFQVVNIAGI